MVLKHALITLALVALPTGAAAQQQRAFCTALEAADSQAPFDTVAGLLDGDSELATLMLTARVCHDLDRLAGARADARSAELLKYVFRESDRLNLFATLQILDNFFYGYAPAAFVDHAVLRDALTRNSRETLIQFRKNMSPEVVEKVAAVCELTYGTLLTGIIATENNDDKKLITAYDRFKALFRAAEPVDGYLPDELAKRVAAYDFALRRFTPEYFDREIDEMSYMGSIRKECDTTRQRDRFVDEYIPSRTVKLQCRRFGELLSSVTFLTRHYWLSESGARYGGIGRAERERDGYGAEKIPNPPISDASCKTSWSEHSADLSRVTLGCHVAVPMVDTSEAEIERLMVDFGRDVTKCLSDHRARLAVPGQKPFVEIDYSWNLAEFAAGYGSGLTTVTAKGIEHDRTGDTPSAKHWQSWGKGVDRGRALQVSFQYADEFALGFLRFGFVFLEKTTSLGPNGMPPSP